MAVVVEQTIPFLSSSLDVENPTRWTTLLPLIRPSVKAVSVGKHTILVDTALASSKYVRVAMIGSLGNFSSKLLESRHVCAVASEKAAGKGGVTAKDMVEALGQGGVDTGPGVVVVRCGGKRRMDIEGKIVDVVVGDGLELDHILHLLGNATGETRSVEITRPGRRTR